MVGNASKEGAVVTRDRGGAANVWHLKDSPSNFLVETNFDHWGPARDKRRDTGHLLFAHEDMLMKGDCCSQEGDDSLEWEL